MKFTKITLLARAEFYVNNTKYLLITFCFYIDFIEVYRSTGLFPENQLAAMAELLQQHAFTAMTVVMWVVAGLVSAIYMLAIKRHFR